MLIHCVATLCLTHYSTDELCGFSIFFSLLLLTMLLRTFLFISSVQFSQSCPNSATPWTVARQTSLSITNSWSPPKHMSIESVMPSNHLILCCPLLLPSIFPSIRVFSNESALHIRWPKYWSFSFNISPSNILYLLGLCYYKRFIWDTEKTFSIYAYCYTVFHKDCIIWHSPQ